MSSRQQQQSSSKHHKRSSCRVSKNDKFMSDKSLNWRNGTVDMRDVHNDINMYDFESLTPYLTKNTSTTLNNNKDNSYADYNEEGQNNINESEYRKEMIARSLLSTMETIKSIFSDNNTRAIEETDNNYYIEANEMSTAKHKLNKTTAHNIVTKYEDIED